MASGRQITLVTVRDAAKSIGMILDVAWFDGDFDSRRTMTANYSQLLILTAQVSKWEIQG